MRQTNAPQSDAQKIGWVIFESVMAILYLVFGGILLFTPLFDNAIHGIFKIVLGVLFGLYGIFRIFRAYRKIVQRNKEN
ncbi:MAG: hypothetical protein LBH12_05510 [Dysgonamonadaceae bacterium]|nr:hypothetical protein [Dysgonamonadaceae bacterium]